MTEQAEKRSPSAYVITAILLRLPIISLSTDLIAALESTLPPRARLLLARLPQRPYECENSGQRTRRAAASRPKESVMFNEPGLRWLVEPLMG